MENSRKRPRQQDDCEECLPISKRINRLQIRPEDQQCQPSQISNNVQIQNGYMNGGENTTGQPVMHHSPMASMHEQFPQREVECRHGVNAACACGVTPPATNPHHSQQLLQDHNGFLGEYRPEMGLTENPHYFRANEQLFEAHRAKLQRNNSDVQPR